MSFQEKKNICSPDACKLTHWFTSFQMDSKLQSYSQTGKTMNTRNISEMLLSCKKKPIGHEKTKLQTRMLISLWFVACSHVLIFAEIGRNTINIPEIFQVFKVFPVAP